MDYAFVLRKMHRNKEAGQVEAHARPILEESERASGGDYRVDVRDLERASK
jgi:hypothetical protein